MRGRDGRFDKIRVWPNSPEFQPTPEELEAILEASTKVRWPSLGYLAELPIGNMPDDIAEASSENLFLFRDPAKSNGFAYVQVYHPGVEGRGKYTSWIHLDNGEWTFGQPDELPLYGAEELGAECFRVFIHEGPKAADRVRKRIQTSQHHWAQELSGTHVGWPGGGNRYLRANWSQLDSLGRDTEIIVVADNDLVGVTAARDISERFLQRFSNVRQLRFPRSWEEGYDLADEWPDTASELSLFLERPRYTGDAASIETAQPVEEVASRLAEQSLAFEMGGRVVIVSEFQSALERDLDDPSQKNIKLRTVTADPETIRTRVEKVSRWEQWSRTDEEMVEKRVPTWVLQQIIQRPSLLPPLAGVINHPVLSGGKMLSGDIGYDKDSCLYLQSPSCSISEWSSASQALEFLCKDWLGRFPFRSREDCLRALLIPLGLLLRRTEVRGGAPIAFVTAPGSQTGKSFLAKTLCLAVLGRQLIPQAFSSNEEEFKKSFMSTLLESPPIIYYDNMPNGWSVGSRELDAYATSDEYADRILGKSERVSVPALSMLLFAGNNIEPKEDTRTRTFEVRLERRSGEEDPGMKDAMLFTASRRGEILSALMAVSKSPPAMGTVASRFPDWERRVAAPLMAVAGCPDLLKELSGAKDNAEVYGWHAEDLEELVVCIYRLQNQHGGFVRANHILEDERCRLAVEALNPKRGTELRAPHIGTLLRRHRDRKIAGLTLRITTQRDQRKGRDVTAYYVEGEAPSDRSEMAPM